MLRGLPENAFCLVHSWRISTADGATSEQEVKTLLDHREQQLNSARDTTPVAFYFWVEDGLSAGQLERDLNDFDNLSEDNPLKRFGLRLLGEVERTNQGSGFLLVPEHKIDMWYCFPHIGKSQDEDLQAEEFEKELREMYGMEFQSFSYPDSWEIEESGLKGHQKYVFN